MTTQIFQANQIATISEQLHKGQIKGLLIFASSRYCPWCGLVSNDQLLPRLNANGLPKIAIVEFDIDDSTPLPTQGDSPSKGLRPTVNMSPLTWAKAHKIRVVPTVTAVDQQLSPLRPPLIGYSSADFYGAYLEEQITKSIRYWVKAR
jgi:hypothetical protein